VKSKIKAGVGSHAEGYNEKVSEWAVANNSKQSLDGQVKEWSNRSTFIAEEIK
jgi:hypothetical protein